MIRALAEARWDRVGAEPVSRQKKDALFELAGRMALLAEAARAAEDPTSVIAQAASAERRRSLKHGLRLLAEGADAERLDRVFDPPSVLRDLDSGTRLELALIRTGLDAVAALEHPVVAMRRMTAWLGPDYFDKASAWALARSSGKRRKRRAAPGLLVPGDLPDLVRDLASEPPSLERALRNAGRGLSAVALAGCPPESMDLARDAFGPIGGAILEEDAEFVRGKLSGDEIAQAQSAFIELMHALEERGELELAGEEEFYNDPAWVEELTRAVMGAADRSIRAVFTEGDKRSLARAMQGMAPEAHERILGLIQKREARRLLDAVDDAAILPRREVIEAGRSLARAFIARAEKPGARDPGDAALFSRLRDWAGAEEAAAAETMGDKAQAAQAEAAAAASPAATSMPPRGQAVEKAAEAPGAKPDGAEAEAEAATAPGRGKRSAADRLKALIDRRKR